MYLLDETFHFGLQTPPSELDGDQFVRAHVRAVRLGLSLQRGGGGTENGNTAQSSTRRRSDSCCCSAAGPGTFHSGLRGPLPVLTDWNRAGSSSGL